ncbi:GAF domain-containing protein [Nocardia veterana]|uniref:Transcriptional regulator n=1 Tax=Nocardia veterana TaxID=132249 RepID=A0A7X6M1K3_9NOCA|nr:GAF domain-containing protein [Nocardia veterana]NKY88586.1 transcriptional regulator [Nocardia veterana]
MNDTSTLARRRAALEDEWARWVRTAGAPPADDRKALGRIMIRPEVSRSWHRSLRSVDPARDSAPGDDSDIGARWLESPLYRPVTELADQLRGIAEDAGFVAAVTDADGTILWSCGGPVMRRRAERVNFAPGGRWGEPHMGTNALSLALRTGRPSTVFSAEHLVAALHGWVCYCAPIHGADGRRLGSLDLSSTWDRTHPLAMATVQSLVTAIENRLCTLAPPAGGLRLTCLGAGRVTRDGHPIRLRPRQIEILTLLALEPGGFTPERLHYAIYGERPIVSSTLKADVSHLRRATEAAIANRVYRLTTPLRCDAADLRTALEAGDAEAALRLYRGPLLPDSETPGIVQWREHLDVAVRTAVLSSGDPGHALALGERMPADIEIHERALELLPPDDGRRAVAAARLHTALRG